MSNPWIWLVERHVNKAFRTRSEGATAFYPLGIWANGYLVTSHEQETTLRAAMRRFALSCFRFMLFFYVALPTAYLVLINLLPAIEVKLPWLVVAAGALLILSQLAAIGILLLIWQCRFRDLACGLEVLPPTIAQLPRVQSTAVSVNRPRMVVRAAFSFALALSGLFVLILRGYCLNLWEAVAVAFIVAAGLGYYVWCRSVMQAKQALGVSRCAEPVASGDGMERRA
ncbi:MAG: hypothetical protein ACYC7J_05245 [Syntrophales bacterium]